MFVFRMLDLARVAPSSELRTVLDKEVIYLYGLLSLLVYGDTRDKNVRALVDWAGSVGSDIRLEVFKDMYLERIRQLDLQKLEPNKFVFSFSTIWDSLHLMCLMGDDVVSNRHQYEPEAVSSCIRNLKWVFYNVFIILFCPVCARHYLTVDSFPYEIERVEVALYREKMGEPLQLVEEINRNQSHKNLLYKNNLLYKSMMFHNHINSYRPIQHKNDELNDFQKMDWTLFKSLLGITN